MDYEKKIIEILESENGSKQYKKMLSRLFPELSQGVDEKIRKEIIQLVEGTTQKGSTQQKKYISYLYKIGKASKDDEYGWSEEDTQNLYDVIREIKANKDEDESGSKEYYIRLLEWLRCLKPQKLSYHDPYKDAIDSIYEMCSKQEVSKCFEMDAREFLAYVQAMCKDAREHYYDPYEKAIDSIYQMCQKYEIIIGSVMAARDFLNNVKAKCKDAKEYF